MLYYSLKSNATIEKEIEKTGNLHKEFRYSADLTRNIFQKIKERAAGLKIYAFCADDQQPYYDEFKQIAASMDFVFIDGIPQAVKACEDSGFVTRAADQGHWNELGQ